MNFLFLTLSKFENLDENQIYNDIFKELAKKGHTIYIVCPETKNSVNNNFDNIYIERVNIKEIRNVNKFKKGLRLIQLEKKYFKKIKSAIPLESIDVLMYSTPPITFNNIVSKIKKSNNKIKTVLVLKDIFPQNAVDLKFIKDKSVVHTYFKRREDNLYKLSDLIGCMSPANIEYIKEHNKIDEKKMFLFRNSLYKNNVTLDEQESKKIITKYNIDENRNLFLYGGNLGIPQYIDGIKHFIKNFYKVENSQLIIIGDGTEYNKLEQYINQINNDNIQIYKKVSKIEFDSLMKFVDVGLIFLHPNFTIPNFPSRFSSYLDFEVPVLASTDLATDMGKIITENQLGYWSYAKNSDELIENAIKLTDKLRRNQMSLKAKELFEKEYAIEVNVDNLLKELKKLEKNI